MAGEYVEFVNNSQPALNEDNLNLMQQRIKQDIVGIIGGDTLPIGTIVKFGTNNVPENWLLCNGQAVSRTDYQYLFNTIGITYGQGDGFTTFNLPNITEENFYYIIKAKQSAGIVATVVDGLNSTSATDALSANQGRLLNGIVVYQDSTGSVGTVNLSESFQDGDKVEIIYCRRRASDGTSILKSTGKIPYIANREIALDINYSSASNGLQMISKLISINQNQITVTREVSSIDLSTPIETATIYILEVIKY